MAQPDRPLGGIGHDANVVYALGHSKGETDRLHRQADELGAVSASLLDRAGLAPGQRALDLGCGPRGVLDVMAARVMPNGTVVGVDADLEHVAAARRFVADRHLSGVEVIAADARATGLAAASFDVVHCRTVLVTIPEPADVVAEMVHLVRPGGWVVAVEPDVEYSMCYPPNAAFDRICELFAVAFSRNDADPMIGRKVPELLRHAGLDDVGVDVRPQLFAPGHTRRTNRLDLVRSLGRQIVEMSLASQAELDDLDRDARDHLIDPATITIAGFLFLVYGRKPD
jgi:SAM-dependent methyltransferase